MLITSPTTDFSHRFPGQIALIMDIKQIQIMTRLQLCDIIRREKNYHMLPSVRMTRDGSWIFVLKQEVHDWLDGQGWRYDLYRDVVDDKLILDLETESRVTMFKLAWQGMA